MMDLMALATSFDDVSAVTGAISVALTAADQAFQLASDPLSIDVFASLDMNDESMIPYGALTCAGGTCVDMDTIDATREAGGAVIVPAYVGIEESARFAARVIAVFTATLLSTAFIGWLFNDNRPQHAAADEAEFRLFTAELAERLLWARSMILARQPDRALMEIEAAIHEVAT